MAETDHGSRWINSANDDNFILCFIWTYSKATIICFLQSRSTFEKLRTHKQEANVVHISQVFVVSQRTFIYFFCLFTCFDLDSTGATQLITSFYGLHKAKTLLISESANSFIRNYVIRLIFDWRGTTHALLTVMQLICFCVFVFVFRQYLLDWLISRNKWEV